MPDLRMLAVVLLLLGTGPETADAAADLFLRFGVLDPRPDIQVPLDERLFLRARRLGDSHHGWEIAVVDRSAGEHSRNLLYHSPSWHGPYPTQILPWHEDARLFPSQRVLPVAGHPYEIEIRLEDLRTAGTGSEARFTSGTIEVRWHRTPTP